MVGRARSEGRLVEMGYGTCGSAGRRVLKWGVCGKRRWMMKSGETSIEGTDRSFAGCGTETGESSGDWTCIARGGGESGGEGGK